MTCCDMLLNCSFKLTKVPDHLMCNLKRSGTFTEKPDFVSLTVLSKESHKKLFAMFLLKSWEFLSDVLVMHSL